MNKKPAETSSAPESISKFNLLIAILCGLLLLAHFISSFFPKSRLWGINHLAYFPLWVRLVFTLPGLLILVPWVNSRIYKFFDRILAFLQKILPKSEVVTASFLAVISMFFFWLLRTRTHFLGDGVLVISLLEKGQLFVKGSEPLEILSHLYLYKFLKLFFTPSAEVIYTALSILAGGAFVIFLFFLTKALFEDRSDRLLAFFIFLFSGATQLFLGYAEHYTLTYVTVFAYLYFSIRYLQGKVKIYLPILLCALSMSLHFSATFLLPSLLFLFALKREKEDFSFSMKKAIPYFIALISLLALSIYYIWSFNPALSEIFVPLVKGRVYAPDYTLFSVPHISDLINQHFLLSPVGIILILSLAIAFKNRILFKKPVIAFLILVSIAQISYHFILDPKLGAGRDWDLLSTVGLGYTLLGVYLFIGLVKSKGYPLVALTFTVFLCSFPWFVLNANTSKAIDRFNNLLDLDVKRSRTGRYTLADYFYQRKIFLEYNETMTLINKFFPEDSLTRRAQTYLDSGNYDQATELLKKAIIINPSFLWAYNDLGAVYLKQGKVDQALNEFQRVVRLNPYNSIARVNLGNALFQKGKLVEALTEYKKAEKLGGIGPNAYRNMANIYLRSEETEKAISAYKSALKLDPKFYYAHFGLGQIYLDRNSLDEAVVEFDQVVKLKPDFAPVYYHLGFINLQKGLKENAIEKYELFLKYSSDEAKKAQVSDWIQQLRSQKP